MQTLMIAEIDWPILTFTFIFLLFLLTWRPYRRLISEINLGAVDGDLERSLDAALRLHRSTLPLAVLSRWITRGQNEVIISYRYYMMGEFAEAGRWCEKGLSSARKPAIKKLLHLNLVGTWSHLGNREKVEEHLEALRALAISQPQDKADYFAAAIGSHLRLGAMDRSAAYMSQTPFHPAATPWLAAAMAASLESMGRFDDVYRLAEEVAHRSPPKALELSPLAKHSTASSLGTRQATETIVRKHQRRVAYSAIRAAIASEQWDLFERYLALAEQIAVKDIHDQCELAGYRAVRAGRQGQKETVEQFAAQLLETVRERPRHRWLRRDVAGLVSQAWLLAGDPERALAELDVISHETVAPIHRARQLALRADCLDALGRPAEATDLRDQSRAIAPGAYWHRGPQPAISLDVTMDRLMPVLESDSETAVGPRWAAAQGPIPPVASGLSCSLWPLTIIAATPVLGALAAIPLVPLSLFGLMRRKHHAHDRPAASAALTISLLSLLFGTVIAIHLIAAVSQPSSDEPDSEALVWEEKIRQIEQLEQEASTQPMSEEEIGRRIEEILDETAFEAEPVTAAQNRQMNAKQISVIFVVLIFSIILHEIAHGLAAYWGGDPTAREQGRFSLNPLRHISWLGSVIVPLLLTILPGDAVIGWAKPVPIQIRRLRHPRRGFLGVSLAGVSANLLLALLASNLLAMILIAMAHLYSNDSLREISECWFDVKTPDDIHPLWGVGITICTTAIMINGLLAAFNLLPIPPLDGFNVVRSISPAFLQPLINKAAGAGTLLLLILIAFQMLHLVLLPGIYIAGLLLGVPWMLALL